VVSNSADDGIMVRGRGRGGRGGEKQPIDPIIFPFSVKVHFRNRKILERGGGGEGKRRGEEKHVFHGTFSPFRRGGANCPKKKGREGKGGEGKREKKGGEKERNHSPYPFSVSSSRRMRDEARPIL